MKFVPKGPINNNPALVQVMTCRLFGANPLPEPTMTKLIDAYMLHLGEMSEKRLVYKSRYRGHGMDK